jgi:hypothetical protein
MAFGITGKYVDANGEVVSFAVPYEERKAKINSLPDRSILLIIVYAHGAPGMIGDDDTDSLANLLKDKMAPSSQIHLLGCSTAGIEAHFWNPVGGLGLLARMIMYHGFPKWANEEDISKKWADNLAGDLSKRIPGVYVMGLSGISFPLSRIPEVTVGKDIEGYSPKGLMGDRFTYSNGRLTELPEDIPIPQPKRLP